MNKTVTPLKSHIKQMKDSGNKQQNRKENVKMYYHSDKNGPCSQATEKVRLGDQRNMTQFGDKNGRKYLFEIGACVMIEIALRTS